MCRVLLWYKTKERDLKDDKKWERSMHEYGDPIVAMPDGHQWGFREGLPNFVSLDLPGVPVAEMEKFCRPEISPILGPGGQALIKRRREYGILICRFTKNIRDGFKTMGRATMSMTELKGCIIHKETKLTR